MSALALLRQATGIDLPRVSAERALRTRMDALRIDQRAAYLALLGGAELEALIELVVVPESWMFRDPAALSAATAFVQRRVADRPGRRPRILSLPCAGGEEPHSLAMALRDAGVAAGACHVEGIDISAASIARARAGRYTRNAFRGADLAFRARHFAADGAVHVLNDEIRAMVAFRQANLFALDTAANAGRYDVLFCRNLLIYFDAATAARAAGVLRALLADDGILFAGSTEVPVFCRHGFAMLPLPGAFGLHKQAAGPGAPATPAVRRLAPAARALPGPGPAELLALAQRQANSGDLAAASAGCHAVLAADPACADAYFLLGMVSDCAGERRAADRYWRRCVYLRPDHYEALCSLALLAEQAGDVAAAGSLRQRATRVIQCRGASLAA
jgi:chemotaxis protein methyltransferase WspC